MSLPVHSLEAAERDLPLFEAVAAAFAQAANTPMRESVKDLKLSGGERVGLFMSGLRLLPAALSNPDARSLAGASILASVTPDTEASKNSLSADLSAEFGYLLASAWVSGVRRSQEKGEVLTPEVVRPSLLGGPSKAWQRITENVKPYGLPPQTVDTILCAGLTQLTQNGADIPLINQIVVPHAVVQTALAKPITLT